MEQPRRLILDWAAQGRLKAPDMARALSLAGVLPAPEDWRRFLDRLLLWLGCVLLAAGLVFFLAFNWNDLGRFGKFALAESLLLAALLLVGRSGLDRPSGKAALLGASLVLGALLALIGQTYQTGADTFELFAVWAAMMLPWALLGRYSALWLLWLLLVNLAIGLYFQTFRGVLGLLFSPQSLLWVLFVFNTACLAAWEASATLGVTWLRPRWAPRVLALAGCASATALAMWSVLRMPREGDALGLMAWLAWLAAAYLLYRRIVPDLFVLAAGMLSVIVVATAFMVRHITWDSGGDFLLVGLTVIALSALGGWWLKGLAREERR
jgi:uncharacterized membrane protein